MNVNDQVKYLLSEDNLNEYSNENDNPYFRKVKNGNGDDLIRRFALRLNSAKKRVDIEIVTQDIEDALEDCGYTENTRQVNRDSAYMNTGMAVGVLSSDRNNVVSSAIIGAGIGYLASKFIKDDGKDIISDHIAKLRDLRTQAKDKMLKAK
jgi:hypothetical protein